MKKFLLIFAVLFASCFEVQVKPREVNAQSISTDFVFYKYSEHTISGMKYGVWVADGGAIRASAVAVINLTKDQMEVELLRKQLEERK